MAGGITFLRIWYRCSINFLDDWYMAFSAQKRWYQICTKVVSLAEKPALPQAVIGIIEQ